MNKTIIGVVVAAIVVIGGYLLLGNNNQQSTEPAAQEQNAPAPAEVVVTYTNDGFAPQEITVKSGTTVVFKNETSGAMWIASGPHPTHENYPEFDTKREYNPGESYSFTFTKTGAWGYHNHLNATKFGKVVVE